MCDLVLHPTVTESQLLLVSCLCVDALGGLSLSIKADLIHLSVLCVADGVGDASSQHLSMKCL